MGNPRFPLLTDSRALSPVIEKTLSAALALLFVGGMTGLLLGGVVPGYQSMANEELSERTLATAAGHLEDAPPETDGRVNSTTTVSLPSTIADTGYWLVLQNDSLLLEHPDSNLEREVTLAVGENITLEASRWSSGSRLSIHVRGPPDNRTLSLGGD
jgi:hypothetical protein